MIKYFILILSVTHIAESRILNCFSRLRTQKETAIVYSPEDILGANTIHRLREEFPGKEILVTKTTSQTKVDKGYFDSVGLSYENKSSPTETFTVTLDGNSIAEFDLVSPQEGHVIIENLELNHPSPAKNKKLKAGQETPGLGLEAAKNIFQFIKKEKQGSRFYACADFYAGLKGYEKFGHFSPTDEKASRVLSRLDSLYFILKKQEVDPKLHPKNLNDYSILLSKSLETTPAYVLDEARKISKGTHDESQLKLIKNDKGEIIAGISKPGTYRAQIFINVAQNSETPEFVSWQNMINSPDAWKLTLMFNE